MNNISGFLPINIDWHFQWWFICWRRSSIKYFMTTNDMKHFFGGGQHSTMVNTLASEPSCPGFDSQHDLQRVCLHRAILALQLKQCRRQLVLPTGWWKAASAQKVCKADHRWVRIGSYPTVCQECCLECSFLRKLCERRIHFSTEFENLFTFGLLKKSEVLLLHFYVCLIFEWCTEKERNSLTYSETAIRPKDAWVWTVTPAIHNR